MEEFLRYVLVDRFAGWRFFAHNGGKYDIRYVFEMIKSMGFHFEFYISGSSVINFTVQREAGERNISWYFTDSFRLLMEGLGKLTKEFDVEHKKLEFDPSSEEYNANDCMGLYEVLTKLFAVRGIAAETIASHSMKVFRTFYLKRQIPQPHEDVEEFVRACYYGGRCEVYRWDTADVNLLDINSMYPWAMKGWIPVQYRCRSVDLPDSDEMGIGFYEADIEYPDVYVPALPFFLDKLYFPVGKFRCRCTSMELRAAIEQGAAVKILRGCVFDVDRIFDDYVDDIYNRKKEADAAGNGALRTVHKYELNTLYGKFGQRRRQIAYAVDPGTPLLYGESGPRVWPMEHYPGLCFYYTDSTSSHILPHISATITARARMRITGILEQAGSIWYTDTDSVFTPNPMPDGVTARISPELGDLGEKGSGRFQAYGLKEYTFGDEMVLKGIPLSVTDEKTGKKTKDYTLGWKYFDRKMVEYRRMAGFMESIRAGESTLRYVTARKQKHVIVQKRASDGLYNTRPWRVEELQEKLMRKPKHSVDVGKSLVTAIQSLGGVNPERIKNSGTWEEWSSLSKGLRLQIYRNKSTNSPDDLASQLAGCGYAWIESENDLLKELHKSPYQGFNFDPVEEKEEIPF